MYADTVKIYIFIAFQPSDYVWNWFSLDFFFIGVLSLISLGLAMDILTLSIYFFLTVNFKKKILFPPS